MKADIQSPVAHLLAKARSACKSLFSKAPEEDAVKAETEETLEQLEASYRELDENDRAFAEGCCERDGGLSGHISFDTMLMVQKMYLEVFTLKWNCVVKKPWISEDALHLLCPIGAPEDRKTAVQKLIRLYSTKYPKIVLYGGSEENLKELQSMEELQILNVFQDRDNQNYMLDAQEQIELVGSKFSDRRNKIRRFGKRYEWRYEVIDQTNLPQCLEIAESWYAAHAEYETAQMEQRALEYSTKRFKELNLQGGLIRVDGQIVAFCIGRPMNKEIYQCDFLKTQQEYQDVALVLLDCFFKENCKEYKYINYSEDMGLPGLRKFKTMLHPAFMTDFYHITVALKA